MPYVRRALLATLLLAGTGLTPLHAQQQPQQGRVTGRIVDAATNRPLAGVQVFIPPTGIGNITDENGRFLLLNVPVGTYTVTAQLVGFKQGDAQATVRAGELAVVDFRLNQTAINLDEIVVTGAGVATQRRKLGNTIATIDVTRIANAPITDFSQILQGREAGVVSLPSSGYTGAGSRIRIRGSSSLSQLNEPIIYVDGIRVDRSGGAMMGGTQSNASRLDDIPPDAIERIEILKGAAAATLYGTEASNGVIQVFTKKGRSGVPRFSVQVDYTAIQMPTDRIAPLADFARTQTEVDRIRERWGRNVALYEVFQEDLAPSFFETGMQQVYSASVTGGGSLITYFVSGRYQGENGPFAFDKFFEPIDGFDPAHDLITRIQGMANLTISPHDKVRIGVSTLYTEVDQESPDNANNIYGLFTSAMFGQARLATATNLLGNSAFATARETMYQVNTSNTKHFAGSTNLNYSPFQALKLDATFGVDFVSEASVRFRPFRWDVDNFTTAQPEGSRTVDEIRNHLITADFKGSWDAALTTDIANTFLAGAQGFLRQRTSKGGSGTRFPGPGLEVVSAGADRSAFESWVRNTQVGAYLQDQIGWQDWAYLTVGGRWDANSAFGEEFEAAFYPKASVSIMPMTPLGLESATLSTLRVRAAIGRSGLQPSAFDKFTTFAPLPSTEGPGVSPANLGNPALKPEVSTEIELGTELGLFNDRASIDLTWWTRDVKDAIVNRQFPVSGGFISTQADNIGRLEGKGLELTTNAKLVQKENVTLSVFANTAFIKETIADMGGAPPLKVGGSYPRYRNFNVKTFAPGSYFGAEVARHLTIPLNLDASCTEPSQQAALAYFSQPRNPSAFKPLVLGNSTFGEPNGQLASHNCGQGALLTYMGKPTPDFAGAFGFNATVFGNFEVNSLFEYSAGDFTWHDLSGEFRRSNPSIGRNTPRARELESTLLNPNSTAQQRLDAAVEWALNYEGLSPLDGLNAIKPADFVRWRELSLTYRIPYTLAERFGLASAALNVGARNLKLWVNSEYPGMDPESNLYSRCNGGLDCNFAAVEAFGVPMTRRFIFSTRVGF
ncbi:MAG TPA: SusC/RagA family TonB-linked outer membrane protein [Longimicrobiales bacterium]|nr:SusC/RagA family TonB-linked outer membrane protein [Longimicrobiales bacterium]